jgi:hypothetical protein
LPTEAKEQENITAPITLTGSSEGELSDLWRLTNGASREWTRHSTKGNGFRIDHAFGNTAFVAATTPICTYDHRGRETGLTDRSAVVIHIIGVAE